MSAPLHARLAPRLRVAPDAAIWLVLVALLLAAALLSDAFLEPIYLANIVRQAAPVGIAAIGATVVMILGGIDLSVGAVVSFAAVFSAIQMAGQSANTGFAIVSTLLVCALLGCVNGALVAYNRASSFILTLGTALAIYGITQIYSGGIASGIVAPGFREFFNFRVGGIVPVIALLMVGLAVLVEALLRLTRFGRSVYLIGSNARRRAHRRPARWRARRCSPTRSRGCSPASPGSRCWRAPASRRRPPGAASNSTRWPRSCSAAPSSKAVAAVPRPPSPVCWCCSSRSTSSTSSG